MVIVGKMDYSTMFPVCRLDAFMFLHSLLILSKAIIILLLKSLFMATLLLSLFAYYKTRYFTCLASQYYNLLMFAYNIER